MVQFEVPPPEGTHFVVQETSPSEPKTTITTVSTTASGDCLKCQKREITYECDPCGCPSFCKDCAPKLASGGKCKTCKAFYGGLRRIRDRS